MTTAATAKVFSEKIAEAIKGFSGKTTSLSLATLKLKSNALIYGRMAGLSLYSGNDPIEVPIPFNEQEKINIDELCGLISKIVFYSGHNNIAKKIAKEQEMILCWEWTEFMQKKCRGYSKLMQELFEISLFYAPRKAVGKVLFFEAQGITTLWCAVQDLIILLNEKDEDDWEEYFRGTYFTTRG